MIKAAIEKILDIGNPITIVSGIREYTSKSIIPVKDPSPKPLSIGTLTGLADYMATNVDAFVAMNLIIHIVDFHAVTLLSRLKMPWQDRDTLIQVSCDTLKFPFGQYMSVEQFIIAMQSQFVQDETTATILKIVGNVTDSVVKQFADDGVTQQATVKAGVSRVENVAVPNPVTLAPYRTFLEVDQPASKFVFRMHSGKEDAPPTCALFEGDGGAWRNDAVQRIKAWLTEKIPGVAIIA